MIAEYHIAAGGLGALLIRDIPGSLDPSARPATAPPGLAVRATQRS